jgi:hypothetical protein
MDGMQAPSGVAKSAVITIVVSTTVTVMDAARGNDKKVLEYVEAMSKIHSNLVLGYEWADSTCSDNRDRMNVDWGDPGSVGESVWFKGYCERVKGQLALMAQLPFTRVEVVCIEGGLISKLVRRKMTRLTRDVELDLEARGVKAQLSMNMITFDAFKEQYNAGKDAQEQ